MVTLFFLSSGLFLGWSLGANDAANVFGTAVGSKMVRFRTAAIVAGVFIVLGAGISGSGTTHTLGTLGSVNELAGSFVVALSAAVTVYAMTKLNLPVSTTQSIVGAIMGWNFFSGSLTDYSSLSKIVTTWITSPLLSGIFAIVLYKIMKIFLRKARVHLLKLDFLNRSGLIIVGAFGSFSLGASNIANVMGVFVTVSPFRPLELSIITLSDTTQLFLLGGLAIAVGVFTYSRRVMATVGSKILKLNPESALVVVLSAGIVMFLFASQGLEHFLASFGLPTLPLVPVSSSQAVIGAVVGIGLLHGGKELNVRVLGKIASGWITAPLLAGILCFVALFIFQNVFNQNVYKAERYHVSAAVAEKMQQEGVMSGTIERIKHKYYPDAYTFYSFLEEDLYIEGDIERREIVSLALVYPMKVDVLLVQKELVSGWLENDQARALMVLDGKRYDYKWQLHDALSSESRLWAYRSSEPRNRLYNRELKNKLDYLCRAFKTAGPLRDQ